MKRLATCNGCGRDVWMSTKCPEHKPHYCHRCTGDKSHIDDTRDRPPSAEIERLNEAIEGSAADQFDEDDIYAHSCEGEMSWGWSEVKARR